MIKTHPQALQTTHPAVQAAEAIHADSAEKPFPATDGLPLVANSSNNRAGQAPDTVLKAVHMNLNLPIGRRSKYP
jgi:hypothetical protein